MPTATLNSVTLASTTHAESVEGNYYFPRGDLVEKYFKPSAAGTITHCPWKGEAHYLDLTLDDKTTVKDVAWYYPTPKEAAKNITGHVAFYKNKVQVTA